ncbi:MAG: hypothetical protein ABW095_09015 [Candidatus Thiodiazotropha sp.]
MNIRICKQPSILLVVAVMLALVGCGGGGGDNDTPSNSNTDDSSDPVTDTDMSISASIWMTSRCKQDNLGVYFLSLFQFTSDGQVLMGYQDFQDSSCSTRASTQLLPSENNGSYTVLGSETLQDGTPGHRMNATIDGKTNDVYFAITTENKLCFSPNLVLQTVDGTFVGNPTPELDYQNCLSVHSPVDNSSPDPDPNPNPTPDPDPADQLTSLEGTAWIASNCVDYGTVYAKLMYQFSGNELTIGAMGYDNASCQGEGTFPGFASYTTSLYYTDLGSTTLPDGTQGYGLRLTNGIDYTNGYYTFTEQNRLCTSYAFDLSNIDDSNTSLDIDYANCLTRTNLQ